MNSDFHILNLAAYKTPEVYEDPHNDYVSFGDNNNFYQELIDAYLNSPTTNSIITGVVGQIYGKGFDALDSNRRPDEFASFKNLFKASDLKRVCLDYKLLGEAAFQVTYKGGKVAQVSHFNRETLRAEKCDDKGKINAYYYSPNWAEHKDGDKLTRIPVFGSGASNEIYIIRKHIPSMHYYSPSDWVSALNYSVLECEVSQYLVNEVTNSFSGTKLVSFTNGVPTSEKQIMIKNEIMNKLTGANGEKVIVSFSDSPENKTTIEDISVSDAADVYQYIAEECTRKLLLANRITSPLLVGIRDGNNGLGSNAEEIENAHNLFDNVVIRPYQNDIIDAIDDILAVNGIALKIYVQTLTPIEFTDETLVTQEQKEEETGQKLSSDTENFDDDEIFKRLSALGENIDTEKWELVDERDVNYDQEEALDKMIDLARAGTAKPNSKSKQDKIVDGVQFKVRYRYSPNTTTENSREFCKKMTALDKLYRKEDIIAMGKQPVNKGFGLEGAATYSIWKYKGGARCSHKWLRQTFRGITEGNISNIDPNISTNKARKAGFNPVNEKEVSMKPKDMENEGFKN